MNVADEEAVSGRCGYAYSKDVETNMIRLIKNMGKRDYQ